MAEEKRERTPKALAGLPLDGLSPESISILAWQEKTMPGFRQAYPDAPMTQVEYDKEPTSPLRPAPLGNTPIGPPS